MNNEYPVNTVRRVYELMDERHITLYQLSQMSGVSHSTIKTTEKRGGQLTVDTIYRICQGLGISMSDFFTEPGDAVEIDTVVVSVSA